MINKKTEIEHLNKITDLWKKGLFKDALALSQLSKLKNPNIDKIAYFHNIKGLVNLSLKDWSAAIVDFNKAIDLDIKFHPAHFNLALAFYDIGNLKQSYLKFLDVLKIDKDNKRAQENIIKILNCINIVSNNDNPFLLANNELQKLSLNIDFSLKITDQEVLSLYNKSKLIVSRFISDFTFREHQLFFHNAVDLNCERHFIIFRKHNTISKSCFSCFKIVIHLYGGVLDIIKLSLIFNHFTFLDNLEMKCRIDFDNKYYRGYIYCSSIEELQNIKQKINKILGRTFNKNFKIEARRGCSEFSKVYPEFGDINDNQKNMTFYNKEWAQAESLVDHQIYKDNVPKLRDAQKPLKNITLNYFLIINNWVNFAKSINDSDAQKIELNHKK